MTASEINVYMAMRYIVIGLHLLKGILSSDYTFSMVEFHDLSDVQPIKHAFYLLAKLIWFKHISIIEENKGLGAASNATKDLS